MVILGVLLQHGCDKVCFSFGRAQLVDDCLSMMPYLIILEVFKCGRVEPGDFFAEVGTELLQGLRSV
jgi:hypothetical protein